MKKIVHHDQVYFIPDMQEWLNISINLVQYINSQGPKPIDISIDVGKACDKIQHLCMMKFLKKLGIEVLYHNQIKPAYYKPTTSITLYREKLKSFALRPGEG
jgi:hypothetical protein